MKKGYNFRSSELEMRIDEEQNIVSTEFAVETPSHALIEDCMLLANKAAASGTVDEKAAAEAALDKSLINVMSVAGQYPDLKASQNFLQLQGQLTDTENQLAFARQYYNDAVAKLNTLIVTLPWLLFNGLAKVSKREFYKAPEGQATPPQVSFS